MNSYNKSYIEKLAKENGFLRDNLEKVKEEVVRFLNDFLVFSDEEHLFIERFNNRVYCPEILFPEGSIAENLKTHPMALWKCRPPEMSK